jgi:hypothetical protein
MRFFSAAISACVLALSASAADVVLTSNLHRDASATLPASDRSRVIWFAKDRLRVEEQTGVMIVRADENKALFVDLENKTFSTISLPFDGTKYVPGDLAKALAVLQVSCTVERTEETKQVSLWKATKHTLTISSPSQPAQIGELWATQDVEFDLKNYLDTVEMWRSIRIGGPIIAREFRKVEGVPVQYTMTVPKGAGVTLTLSETMLSIERKEPPAHNYEAPADFKEVPFDLQAYQARAMQTPKASTTPAASEKSTPPK